MARIIETAIGRTFGTNSSAFPWLSWFSQQEDGDFILVMAHNDVGTTALSISAGWTAIGAAAPNNSGTRTGFWWARKSGGVDVTEPTITGTNAPWVGAALLIRGLDSTTPIDAFAITEQNAVTTLPVAPNVTTTVNNAMVITCVGWDAGPAIGLQSPFDEVHVARLTDVDSQTGGAAGLSVSYKNAAVAGSVLGSAFSVGGLNDGGRLLTLALRRDSGSAIQGYPISNPSLQFLGSIIGSHEDMSSVIASIDGETLQTASIATTGRNGANVGLANEIFRRTALYRASPPTATSGTRGSLVLLPETLNLENKLFGIVFFNENDGNLDQNYKPLFVFVDGSGNWAACRTGLNTRDVGANTATLFFPPDFQVDGSVSPIDWSDVRKFGLTLFHLGFNTNNTGYAYCWMAAFPIGDSFFTMSGEVLPSDIAAVMQSQGSRTWANLQGGTQLLARMSFRIGGEAPVLFNGEGVSIAYPVNNPANAFSPRAQDLTVDIDAGSGDAINLGALTFASQGASVRLLIDDAIEASAVSDTAAAILGASFVCSDNLPMVGALFSACKTIDVGAASLIRCRIKSGVDAASASVSAGAVIEGCEFVAGSETYAIEVTTAGTISLEGSTFYGYTKTLNVTATSGTVTVVLTEGQTVPTFDTAGASVVFDQPVIAAEGSITNIVTGSRLQVFNETTNTEVFNDIVVGTTYSNTYTEGTTFTAGDIVRVRLAYQSGTTAKLPVQYRTVATAAGWSILADQEDDTVYIQNAIDGDTVTEFIEDFPNVEIDIDDPDGVTTVQRGYAWYIAGQMTADGIRFFHGGMVAEDDVNYRINVNVVDMRIQSINPLPVRVIGGRLYRSDGSTAIAPGGGGVQMEYGRAYAVETGVSGLTPAESDRLMQSALQTTAADAARNAALAAALSA